MALNHHFSQRQRQKCKMQKTQWTLAVVNMKGVKNLCCYRCPVKMKRKSKNRQPKSAVSGITQLSMSRTSTDYEKQYERSSTECYCSAWMVLSCTVIFFNKWILDRAKYRMSSFRSHTMNTETKLALSNLSDMLPSYLRDYHDPKHCSDHLFPRWTALCENDAKPVPASYCSYRCSVQPQLGLQQLTISLSQCCFYSDVESW